MSPAVGCHRWGTHLQRFLFLPPAPMEDEEEEEEGGCERSREEALGGASHGSGPCAEACGRKGTSGHRPGKITVPWMGQGGSAWTHPWGCPRALSTQGGHGAAGDTWALSPLGRQGQDTPTQPAKNQIRWNPPQTALQHPQPSPELEAGGARVTHTSGWPSGQGDTPGSVTETSGLGTKDSGLGTEPWEALGSQSCNSSSAGPGRFRSPSCVPSAPGTHRRIPAQTLTCLAVVPEGGECHLQGILTALEIFWLVAEVWQDSKRLLCVYLGFPIINITES